MDVQQRSERYVFTVTPRTTPYKLSLDRAVDNGIFNGKRSWPERDGALGATRAQKGAQSLAGSSDTENRCCLSWVSDNFPGYAKTKTPSGVTQGMRAPLRIWTQPLVAVAVVACAPVPGSGSQDAMTSHVDGSVDGFDDGILEEVGGGSYRSRFRLSGPDRLPTFDPGGCPYGILEGERSGDSIWLQVEDLGRLPARRCRVCEGDECGEAFVLREAHGICFRLRIACPSRTPGL